MAVAITAIVVAGAATAVAAVAVAGAAGAAAAAAAAAVAAAGRNTCFRPRERVYLRRRVHGDWLAWAAAVTAQVRLGSPTG